MTARYGMAWFTVLRVIVVACFALALALPTWSDVKHAGSGDAVPTRDFLDSIGVVTTFPDRGQPYERTVEMLRYGGFRWVRAGVEGVSDDGPTTMQTFLDLHRETGVRFSWGLGSGGADLDRLVRTGRTLAKAGALLAFEGANEPNNWGLVYKGEKGGGRAPSWRAVAMLQRDLYAAVKSDGEIAGYPVWTVSESGAQVDNVGLQFLTIPPGARTLMPDGTRYADYANVHNYVYHPHAPHLADNKTWDAADPSAASRVDGLFGNYGVTWLNRFRGYSDTDLATIPRVTTETGAKIEGSVTEKIHGLNLMSLYLAQFKRGYRHTAVYLLRDRSDEAGNQAFGFYRPDYSPRPAATYLHNLTTILADRGVSPARGRLEFDIEGRSDTIHDLLLRRSDGMFQLIVWGECLRCEKKVTVQFAKTQASIAVYDPTIGVRPLQSLAHASSVPLTLADHPLIVVISPGALEPAGLDGGAPSTR